MPAKKLNLVVKIGTAALSASGGMPDSALLGRLASELATLKKAGHQVVLVTSGAMGTGRALVKKQQPLKHCSPVVERQILASLGQARLITLYQEVLAPHGMLPSQILLTKQDFRTRTHQKCIAQLFAALERQPHILPVVNENDSVTVEELMFTDNDELAGLLAAMMNADRLIILSHIAGVYDRAPDEKGAQIISTIEGGKTGTLSSRGKSQSGRGGMTSKLAVAKKMAALSIRTHIASANERDVIARLLEDEGSAPPCCRCPASATPSSAGSPAK